MPRCRSRKIPIWNFWFLRMNWMRMSTLPPQNFHEEENFPNNFNNARINIWSKQNKENDMKVIRNYFTHFVLTNQTSKQQIFQENLKTITCNFESLEVEYGCLDFVKLNVPVQYFSKCCPWISRSASSVSMRPTVGFIRNLPMTQGCSKVWESVLDYQPFSVVEKEEFLKATQAIHLSTQFLLEIIEKHVSEFLSAESKKVLSITKCAHSKQAYFSITNIKCSDGEYNPAADSS